MIIFDFGIDSVETSENAPIKAIIKINLISFLAGTMS